MQIILLENIKNLGNIGDVLNVKRGYARNYLIKNNKALYASKENIDEVNKKLQADKDKLSNRLSKHDIGNLAENKPGLVEKIINKASDSAVRCMEIASGSPLTEEELNGSPNRECPSFWPSNTTAE